VYSDKNLLPKGMAKGDFATPGKYSKLRVR